MIRSANKLTFTTVVAWGTIMLSTGITACHKTESPEELITDAQQYQQKGDNKAAIIQLKNALLQNPNNADARFLLGTIYSDTGDPISAEKELRKALSLGMNPGKVLPALGITLLAQGKYQNLLDDTQQESGKNAPDILTLRGDAYYALGKSDEAKASFEAALKTKDDYANALIGLARYSLSQKNVDDANRFSEEAVTKNPKDAEAWMFKGDLLKAQQKTDLARAAYTQALAIKPNHVAAHIKRAYIEIETGGFDAAKADVDAARKVSPNNLTVVYTQALLDFTQGKNAAALESLQKILRVAPDHMATILMAGAVEYNLGSTQQAEQHLRKYLEKNPDNLYARKLLTTVLLKNGDSPDALAILAPALKDPKQDAQLFALAGQSYMQSRDFGKASEYFEQASALAPQVATLHTSLGMSKLAQGDDTDAVSEMELATTLDAKSPKAGITLIMTELRLKQYDKALAAGQDLVKKQPNNPVVFNLMGAVYMAKGDMVNARASFEKSIALQPTYFPSVNNLAQLDLREKKPDAAKKRYESVLEKDKKNTDAMNALAGMALRQGHPEEATVWLEKANSENPDAVGPAIQLTAQYLRTGQKQKALILARKFQTANPTNADLLDLLARTQLANDDQAGALDTYSKLANVVPNSAMAQLRLASVHTLMKNNEAAAEDLKKALSLQPDFVPAELAQAQLDVQNGNIDHALTIAHQIQKQHEKAADGYILEGNLLTLQKKPAPALHAYEQAFAINKNPGLMIRMDSLLRQTGKKNDADLRMAQWQKEHPNDALTLMYLAENNIADKQYKIATEQLQSVLNILPQNAMALNDLAWVYQQEKDPRATATAEQALQLAADSPIIMDTLGWILIEQGNTSRGLPLLKKAATLAPTAMDIHYHLASGLAKSGDKVNARQELEQLLASGKNFPEEADARALLKQL